MFAVAIASMLLGVPSDGGRSLWYAPLRAKYDAFARGLERNDPAFLAFVDPSFVYVGPEGKRMGAKPWTEAMRRACRRNKNAKVDFRITEIRQKGDRVHVSYVWSYRYRGKAAAIPRLTESISTDTWRVVGSDLRLVVSKDYNLWHR